MTLTVVDGDFPRELLAKQNLTFAEYRMPSRRNRAENYDAKVNGAAPKKQGILKVGALAPVEKATIATGDKQSNRAEPWVWLISIVVGVVALLHLRRKSIG